MHQKLSIIIPGYNCSSTLEEAVDSVYVQNWEVPFEIVMVDDASTDTTWEVMQKLAGQHKEIRLLRHETNLGGGAARNTAIKAATGELIFCLDGDDVLPPGMLPKLLAYREEKECDGVVFAESRFFTRDTRKIAGVGRNRMAGKQVVFQDLFDEQAGPLTTVNFLFTRQAFESVGGYTERHGFDTQDFGCRFLAKGLSVFVCPESYYFHRQGFKQRSYFERVYAAGEYSVNTYLIYESVLYLFSQKIRELIVNYDIFANSKLITRNLGSEVAKAYTQNPKAFFTADMDQYLQPEGDEQYFKAHMSSTENTNIFCRAVHYYAQGNYTEALSAYQHLAEKVGVSKVMFFNIARIYLALSRNIEPRKIEPKALEMLQSFGVTRQKINLRPNLFVKILIKLKQAAKGVIRRGK